MADDRLQEIKEDIERGRKYDVPNDWDCNYEELYDTMDELITAYENRGELLQLALGNTDKLNEELAEMQEKNKILVAEVEEHNCACGDALDGLWKEIILSTHPDYGDWSYSGEAYRHIKTEFDNLHKQLDASHAVNDVYKNMIGVLELTIELLETNGGK